MVEQLDLFPAKLGRHGNSLKAYFSKPNRINRLTRAIAVFNYIKAHEGCTDRDVMRGLGFAERNAVSPRISEMIQSKAVQECGNTYIEQNGRRVSVRKLKVVL